jgi:uncharacterized metal-binding protein YceD (DUF177 family)
VIPNYISRFVINEKTKKEEEQISDDEVFVINTRNETIDLEPMILQAIRLEEPFVKRCTKCEKEIEKISDDDELAE